MLCAAVRLACVGVLNKDDLVDELALALTALAPEKRDWRARSGLPADKLRWLEADACALF